LLHIRVKHGLKKKRERVALLADLITTSAIMPTSQPMV
jgi:hypothetical protein